MGCIRIFRDSTEFIRSCRVVQDLKGLGLGAQLAFRRPLWVQRARRVVKRVSRGFTGFRFFLVYGERLYRAHRASHGL